MATGNGGVAMSALQAECVSAIEDIKEAPHTSGCGSHQPLARGVIALLRVKVEEINMSQKLWARSDARRWDVLMRTLPYAVTALCSILGAVLGVKFL